MTTRFAVTASRITSILLAASVAASAQSGAAAPDHAVASAGSDVITEAQLAEAIGGKSMMAETLLYQLRRQTLEEMLTTRLMAKEASRRGISVDELKTIEIDHKVADISDDDARLAFASAPQAFGGRSETDAIPIIKQRVREQRLADRRQAFGVEIRKAYQARILIDPPRTQLALGDSPHTRGPADAAVTIVEFSDFQCPFCARLSPTLDQLVKAFPKDVRLVFKHYPLPNHDKAMPSALAAECAAEEGRFWDMERTLFENQARLSDASLLDFASQLHLDSESFKQCVNTKRHESDILRDRQDGDRYGVGSTPTMFINGRLVPGAQPYDALVAIVNEELDRSTARTSQPR